MHRHILATVIFGLALSMDAQAQQRYIDDTCFVPMRSGAGLDYRIVNQGLPSGTPVQLVETDREAGWSKVRTNSGGEGWMPSRFLKNLPGAQQQIDSMLAQLGHNEDEKPSLEQAVALIIDERDALISERDSLREELAEMKQLSANAMELDSSNRVLNEELHNLRNRLGVVESDNMRLRDDLWQKWFINGVWATGVGGLLTILIPKLFTRRRRNSEWV